MMLHTKREVEEAKCNPEALYHISNLGESYSLPSLVNDDRLEVYVESQQDNALLPIVTNPPVEDGGLSAMPRDSSKISTVMALKLTQLIQHFIQATL